MFHVRADDRNTNSILETVTDCEQEAGDGAALSRPRCAKATSASCSSTASRSARSCACRATTRRARNLHVGGTRGRRPRSTRATREICRRRWARAARRRPVLRRHRRHRRQAHRGERHLADGRAGDRSPGGRAARGARGRLARAARPARDRDRAAAALRRWFWLLSARLRRFAAAMTFVTPHAFASQLRLALLRDLARGRAPLGALVSPVPAVEPVDLRRPGLSRQSAVDRRHADVPAAARCSAPRSALKLDAGRLLLLRLRRHVSAGAQLRARACRARCSRRCCSAPAAGWRCTSPKATAPSSARRCFPTRSYFYRRARRRIRVAAFRSARSPPGSSRTAAPRRRRWRSCILATVAIIDAIKRRSARPFCRSLVAGGVALAVGALRVFARAAVRLRSSAPPVRDRRQHARRR